MKIKNRIQKLEQSIFKNRKYPAICVETIDGELSINEEKSDPDALQKFYRDLDLVYGNKTSEERNK